MLKLLFNIAILAGLALKQSTASGSCQNANWWSSFDRTGWSKCPATFPYINGLYRSKATRPNRDYIYLLESAKCCGKGKSNAECRQVNWVRSFDRTRNWNLCPSGYYLSGLYRSGGHNLHNIEHAWCCKPRGAPNSYKSCYNENVYSKFDWNKKGMVSCSRSGYYITGLYRSTCNYMYCIELFKCCQLQIGEEKATCSATGDPHYRTFDGRTIHFQGKCQYILAKDTGKTFTVLGKNKLCGSKATCTREVTVKVKNLDIDIKRGGVTTVFGIVKRLPYTNLGVTIKKVGRLVIVTTNVGLTVSYDCVYNVYITVSKKYRGKTRGICGNYNGNPNDLLKSDNRYTKNDQDFANSWKVDKSCPNSPTPTNPCKTAGARAQEAKRKCGLLRRSPFSACHNHVKVDSGFIQDCEYDVCACRDNPVSCLCEEYDAYVTMCGFAGVNIKWKHLSQFSQCGSPCASAPCLNGGVCTNHGRNFKCRCPKGYYGDRCQTGASGSCQNANWWLSFDRQGWSKCPATFPYISGLYRSKASRPNHDYIYLLESAKCCSNGKSNAVCQQANWVRSFDRTRNWNLCPSGYYLSGLYRSGGHNLHNIEHAWCCKPRGAPNSYKSCYNENVYSKFDWNKKGMVSCSRSGYYITGLYRSTCNYMYCIEYFKCCQLQTGGSPCASAPCLNSGVCINNGKSFKCKCPQGYHGNRCQTEVQATCSATGDPHYRTFDGKTYNFMGQCEYVLAKDTNNKFTVLGKNRPCGNLARRPPQTCTFAVTVKTKGLQIKLNRGGHVQVSGKNIRLPYNNRGVKVVKHGGRTVRVTTDIGLSVQYDGVYNVFVTVYGRYKGKTLGLCGTFTGNTKDDFKKPNNKITTNVQEFGTSWKVDKDCHDLGPPINPCDKAGAVAQQAKKKCSVLRKLPFSACHHRVKVDSGFIQDCEYDVCACKSHPLSCLCEELDAYATTCSYVGVNIAWRKLSQFRECQTPCALAPCLNGGTCKNVGSSYKCTCPVGFKGTRCETEDTATCRAYGDPHYQTFDAKKYNYMGICEYVLSKDLDNNFLVLTKNVRCFRRYSCVFSVTVIVKGLKIKITRGGTFTVFGIRKTAPYINQGVKVSKSGIRTIRIETDIGVKVEYDGVYNVFVTLSARYRGKTAGLCGNYNGNSKDDFLDVNFQRSYTIKHFGDSWKIDQSCPNSPNPGNPCNTASKIAQEAKKKCQLLKKQPFAKCHNSVNQNSGFIRDCEYDVCACNNHPWSCLCEEFDAYATSCSLVGVPITWRNLPQFAECNTPCAAAPCRNGATCSNHGKGYKCACETGYTGRQCETRTCKSPKALGMESGKIKDYQITASSVWDRNHGAANARLNFAKKSGSWSSRRNDVKQWLQVDFKYTATITDILTQGRGKHRQWVRSYTVSYSNDGVNFKSYQKSGKNKVFVSNSNEKSVVKNTLHPIIVARFIRIHPKTWNSHISMRVEFNGCFEDQPCAEEPCQNEGKCSSVGDKFSCSCLAGYCGDRCEQKECKQPLPLGMENGEIPDSQISASSEWDVNHGAINSRLNFRAQGKRQGAWSARRNDLKQWLQINFNRQATVTDILTQGRSNYNQWVKSYTVSYSNDGLNFFSYRVNGVIKVFGGNRDRNSIVRQSVSPVIITKFIRIHPKSWYGHISMRVGFRGCLKEWPCESKPCRNGGTCVDYRGGYLCACAKGWAGKNCEQNVGNCVPRK